jgi:hypothetical protein
MRTAAILLLLLCLGLALPAVARDPYAPSRRHAARIDAAVHNSGARDAARTQMRRLDAYTQRRSAEAGARLLQNRRTVERRIRMVELSTSGTPAQVRSYRDRVQLENRSDDLRLRIQAGSAAQRTRQRLRDADPDWWASLGPETRRIFDGSGVTVYRDQQLREERRELDALEQAVEGRETVPSFSTGEAETFN